MITVKSPVGLLNMVGKVYEKRLQKLGINTIGDLLHHIPFRYEDYSIISKIGKLQEGETVSVKGTIKNFKNIYTKYGKKIQELTVGDETGEFHAIFFNMPFLSNILKIGQSVALSGQVKRYINHLAFIAPEYELLNNQNELIHTGRLVPVYRETEGISSKWLRSRIGSLLYKFRINVAEFVPEEIIKNYGLLPINTAVKNAHFPKSQKEAREARNRLSFNELFIIHLVSLSRKKHLKNQKTNASLNFEKFSDEIERFKHNLNFKLTLSQEKALREILSDLEKDTPMNRLLEGDVGSGKTIVAVIASYFISLSGYKVLLMAPTEILAKQHYETFSGYLSHFKIQIALLTGKEKPENKKEADIIIGTHALLNREFDRQKIALVIIDEQHRFGVNQRAALIKKGANSPHFLSMTATPIPRTVALSLYSDLDLSVIDTLPLGRKRVKTFIVNKEKRQKAYDWIKKHLKESNNENSVFIICPLVEESDNLITVKSAKKEYDYLKKEIFPDFSMGLIHGKMKSEEKNTAIKNMASGKINILVATPVVEVGIDVKNATIIVIEGSERFGLSQLHQLRGRVGRANIESFCLLFTENSNQEVLDRLSILEKHHIGPNIAELDLKIRGAGQFFGTKQHGDLGLKFTDISDLKGITIAKNAADFFSKNYKSITAFPLLQEKLSEYTIQTVSRD